MLEENTEILTDKLLSDEPTRKGHSYITRIDDFNNSRFNLEVFKESLSKAQEGYHIRVAEGYWPHKRSPKRITMLVSEAYLTSGGSIHWVQDLEAEVYKLCKEYYLDCDELEMESADRSYVCRDKKSKSYGRKIVATQFDNHVVCERNFSREDISLARAIVHYFTYHYYKKEDLKNGATYHPGKGVIRITGDKQISSLSIKKRERVTICQPNSDRKNLSFRKIHGLGKPKLHNRGKRV